MSNKYLEKTHEIEKMLKRDARQQKSIGSGVFHRASRRGYIKGGIKTPYDYMTTKERKNLNGEVKTYMIYEQGIEYVKTLDEIMEMPSEERLTYFNNIMKHYNVRELCSKWKVSTSTLYNKYIPVIGYEKNTASALKKAGRKKKDHSASEQQTTQQTTQAVEQQAVTQPIENNVVNTTAVTPDNVNTAINNNQPLDTVAQTNQNDANHINRILENKQYFEQEFKLKGRYSLSNIDSIYNKIKILLDQGLLYDIEINVKEARHQ